MSAQAIAKANALTLTFMIAMNVSAGIVFV